MFILSLRKKFGKWQEVFLIAKKRALKRRIKPHQGALFAQYGVF